MEDELRKVKKASSASLRKELSKAQYSDEDVESFSRQQLIVECMQVRGYTISEREASETVEVHGAGVGQGQSSLEAMMTIFMQKMMADEERERRREEEREEREKLREQADKERDLKLVQLMLEQKLAADVALKAQREASDAQNQLLAESLKQSFRSFEAKEEQAKNERQADRDRSEAKEKSKETLLKRYGDLLKNTLTKQPDDDHDLPVYLNSVETVFALHGVPDEIRVTLLMPFLTQRARTILCRLPSDSIKTYDQMKAALLCEFKLTPKEYLRQFSRAAKQHDETFVQCNTRLRTIWRYYLDSRKVNDFEGLVDLIVADKLKELMPSDVREYVVGREGVETFTSIKLAELAERYMGEVREVSSNRDKGRSQKWNQTFPKREFDVSDRSQPNSRHDSKSSEFKSSEQSAKSEKRQFNRRPVRCYNCQGLGHISRQCPKPKVQAKVRQCAVTNVSDLPVNHVERDEMVDRAEEFDVLFSSDRNRTQSLAVRPVGVGLSEADNSFLFRPETVDIFVDDVKINCVIDSGAQVSVIRKSLIPDACFVDVGKIVLQSAFGQSIEARLIDLPCHIGQPSQSGAHTGNVSLCHKTNLICAVTNELSHDTDGLLTPDAYDQLLQNEQVYLSAILHINAEPVGLTLEGDNDVLPNEPSSGGDNDDAEPHNFAIEMREQQRADVTLKSSFEFAAKHKGNLYLRKYDGLLCRRDQVGGIDVHQLVLPVAKRKEALVLAHDTLWGGHLGAKKCLQRIKMSFGGQPYAKMCVHGVVHAKIASYANVLRGLIVCQYQPWSVLMRPLR
jgi:hypothetical protein